jgi:patatin-like phospholipase/acyl hydrolase
MLNIEKLVGKDKSIETDIVISDVLFPAWNNDDRQPLFFSKSHLMNPDTSYVRPEYEHLDLASMVTCSASNSIYFSPYKFNYKDASGKKVTETINGGISIAESPSLYAFISAVEFLDVPPKKITMTIVGSLTQ